MPSHYLNQCQNIVNLTIRNKIQWNVKRYSYIFIQENPFQNVVWKMAAISSRPQCVNTLWPSDTIWHQANADSGNGLLPDSTKPLHGSLCTNHQWSIVAFTGNAQDIYPWYELKNDAIHYRSPISQGPNCLMAWSWYGDSCCIIKPVIVMLWLRRMNALETATSQIGSGLLKWSPV